MKNLLPVCLLILAACSPRITLTETPATSATLKPALCESGEAAVTLWEVTSLLTGESHAFRLGKGAYVGEVYLRPGRYEIEAGCNRGKNACGELKGWFHLDGAPTIRLTLEAGARITLDCEATSAALVVRR